MSLGLDPLSANFVTMQGQVELISQMEPKGSKGKIGLLEMLEEVIIDSKDK